MYAFKTAHLFARTAPISDWGSINIFGCNFMSVISSFWSEYTSVVEILRALFFTPLYFQEQSGPVASNWPLPRRLPRPCDAFGPCGGLAAWAAPAGELIFCGSSKVLKMLGEITGRTWGCLFLFCSFGKVRFWHFCKPASGLPNRFRKWPVACWRCKAILEKRHWWTALLAGPPDWFRVLHLVGKSDLWNFSVKFPWPKVPLVAKYPLHL